MDEFIDICLEEVALEGLDGITLNCLWMRLADHGPPFTLKVDHFCKNAFWEALVASQDVKFYELPAPRDVPIIARNYEPATGFIMVDERGPEEIYPPNPISNEKYGVFGSCSTYFTRKDITDSIRGTDGSMQMTLDEASKRFGDSLVLVGSQDLRLKALFGTEVVFTNEMSDQLYIALEWIGRSRHHGVFQSDSVRAVNVEHKMMFYYRNILKQKGLITFQMVIRQEGTRAFTQVNLLFLTRKTVIQPYCRYDLMSEDTSRYLEATPHRMAPMKDVIAHVLSLHKLDDSELFHRNMVVMKATGYIEKLNIPHMLATGFRKKKYQGADDSSVGVYHLLKVFRIKTDVGEEEPEEPAVDPQSCVLYMGRSAMAQINDMIVGNHALEGKATTLIEICTSLNLTFQNTRVLTKKLLGMNVIRGELMNRGKQKVFGFFPAIHTPKSEVEGASATVAAVKLKNERSAMKPTQTLGDPSQVNEGSSNVSSPFLTPKDKRSRSPTASQDFTEVRRQKRRDIILQTLSEQKVVLGYYVICKAIREFELKEGRKAQVDRKTVLRLLGKCVSAKLINMFTVQLSGGDEVTQVYTHHTITTQEDPLFQSIVHEQELASGACRREEILAKRRIKDAQKREAELIEKPLLYCAPLEKERAEAELAKETGNDKTAEETDVPEENNTTLPRKTFNKGFTKGYLPKMPRLRTLHMYLWYLVYDPDMRRGEKESSTSKKSLDEVHTTETDAGTVRDVAPGLGPSETIAPGEDQCEMEAVPGVPGEPNRTTAEEPESDTADARIADQAGEGSSEVLLPGETLAKQDLQDVDDGDIVQETITGASVDSPSSAADQSDIPAMSEVDGDIGDDDSDMEGMVVDHTESAPKEQDIDEQERENFDVGCREGIDTVEDSSAGGSQTLRGAGVQIERTDISEVISKADADDGNSARGGDQEQNKVTGGERSEAEGDRKTDDKRPASPVEVEADLSPDGSQEVQGGSQEVGTADRLQESGEGAEETTVGGVEGSNTEEDKKESEGKPPGTLVELDVQEHSQEETAERGHESMKTADDTTMDGAGKSDAHQDSHVHKKKPKGKKESTKHRRRDPAPPKMYSECRDWRRFVKPLPHHDALSGWFMLGDILTRMPILIFAQTTCTQQSMKIDLSEYTEDPIKRYWPISSLPKKIRAKIQYRRNLIGKVEGHLDLLSKLGLVWFTTVVHKTKELRWFYLTSKAILCDTTSSEPGYMLTSEKDYPEEIYELTDFKAVQRYWTDLKSISLNTPLGLFRSEYSLEYTKTEYAITRQLVLHCAGNHMRPEMEGWIPGDRRGACGFDSSTYSHLRRNWVWVSLLTGFKRQSSLQSIPKAKTNLKRAVTHHGSSTIRPAVSIIKDGKKMQVPVKIRKVSSKGHRESTKGGKGLKRKQPRKHNPIPEKRLKIADRPLPYTLHQTIDEGDLTALKKLKTRRSTWTSREDNYILLFSLTSAVLNQKLKPKRSFVSWKQIRDIMHSYLAVSKDKTSFAIARRSKYIFNNPQTKHNFSTCFTEIIEDKELMSEFMDRCEEYEEPEVRLAEYKELLTKLIEKYREHSSRDSSWLSGLTLEDLKEKYETMTPILQVPSRVKVIAKEEVTCEADIHVAVIQTLIMGALHTRSLTGYDPCTMYNVFSNYEEPLMQKAFNYMRDISICSRFRNLRDPMAPSLVRVLPQVPMSYQLSSNYYRFIHSRIREIIYQEMTDFVHSVKTAKDGALSIPINPQGGCCAVTLETVIMGMADVDLVLPEHIIIFDADFLKTEELLRKPTKKKHALKNPDGGGNDTGLVQEEEEEEDDEMIDNELLKLISETQEEIRQCKLPKPREPAGPLDPTRPQDSTGAHELSRINDPSRPSQPIRTTEPLGPDKPMEPSRPHEPPTNPHPVGVPDPGSSESVMETNKPASGTDGNDNKDSTGIGQPGPSNDKASAKDLSLDAMVKEALNLPLSEMSTKGSILLLRGLYHAEAMSDRYRVKEDLMINSCDLTLRIGQPDPLSHLGRGVTPKVGSLAEFCETDFRRRFVPFESHDPVSYCPEDLRRLLRAKQIPQVDHSWKAFTERYQLRGGRPEQLNYLKEVFCFIRGKGLMGVTVPEARTQHGGEDWKKFIQNVAVLVEEDMVVEVGLLQLRFVATVNATPWLVHVPSSQVEPSFFSNSAGNLASFQRRGKGPKTIDKSAGGLDSSSGNSGCKLSDNGALLGGEGHGCSSRQEEKEGAPAKIQEMGSSAGLEGQANAAGQFGAVGSETMISKETSGSIDDNDSSLKAVTDVQGAECGPSDGSEPHAESRADIAGADVVASRQDQRTINEDGQQIGVEQRRGSEDDQNLGPTDTTQSDVQSVEDFPPLLDEWGLAAEDSPNKERSTSEAKRGPRDMILQQFCQINGEVNAKQYRLIASKVVNTVLINPGIREECIQKEIEPVVHPMECLHLLQHLVCFGCITRHRSEYRLLKGPFDVRGEITHCDYYMPAIDCMTKFALLLENLSSLEPDN